MVCEACSRCCPTRRAFCYSALFTMLLCVVVFSIWGFTGATFSSLGKLVPDIPNPLNVLFQNKCIEDLGCFYTGPPFYHPINRPISLTPTDNLKTKFLLFTPTNPKDEQELNFTENSVESSSFDPELPIKVLIHGYRSDLDVDDIRFKIKEALLNVSDYNIIIVDWTENNGPPYPQALANARAVGAQLAKLLTLIMDMHGIRPENIHIIGHSLGAQMAGWTGERIPNIGRITGLDPAGPFFQDGANEIRLDATDALFVDVIHTDGGENVVDGLGIGDPVGHIDFYPNGGRRQPGCVYASDSNGAVGAIVNATTKWIINGCDHGRANKFFFESINNFKCRFLATWCNSYDDFEKGDCLPQNSTLSEMGLHAKKIPGVPMKSKFFLRTNGESPFCIQNSVYLTNDDTINEEKTGEDENA